ANGGEEQRFCEEQPEKGAAAGAERRANADLTSTRRRSAQDEIGDIRACDEQHQTNGSKEQEQRRLGSPDDVLTKRRGTKCYLQAGVTNHRREVRVDPRRNRIELSLGNAERHVRLQPSHDRVIELVAARLPLPIGER